MEHVACAGEADEVLQNSWTCKVSVKDTWLEDADCDLCRGKESLVQRSSSNPNGDAEENVERQVGEGY